MILDVHHYARLTGIGNYFIKARVHVAFAFSPFNTSDCIPREVRLIIFNDIVRQCEPQEK